MKSLYPHIAVAILLATVMTAFAFVESASAPKVVNYAPKRGDPGTPVNIIGDGFKAGDVASISVRFGSTPTLGVTVKNDQHIQTTVPTLSNGVYPVIVGFTDVSGSFHEQVIGGFTVGPPLTGLVLNSIFPDSVPREGGVTIFLLGNGFKEAGRNDSPTIQIGDGPLLVAHTIDDSLIQLDNIPGDPFIHPPECVPLAIFFSDNAHLLASPGICYQ